MRVDGTGVSDERHRHVADDHPVLPELRFQGGATLPPVGNVDSFDHHLEDHDLVMGRALVVVPEPFGGRLQICGDAFVALGQFLLYALELLGQSDIAPSSPVEARVRLQLETLPLAPTHLYSPPRKRRPPVERVVEIKPPDIALKRYLEAVDYFSARVGVTPAKLSAYVERSLGEKDEAGPEAFPVAHIDDFILFERLHEVGLAPLDRLYEFVEKEGDSANDWIERRDFVVRRKKMVDG